MPHPAVRDKNYKVSAMEIANEVYDLQVRMQQYYRTHNKDDPCPKEYPEETEPSEENEPLSARKEHKTQDKQQPGPSHRDQDEEQPGPSHQADTSPIGSPTRRKPARQPKTPRKPMTPSKSPLKGSHKRPMSIEQKADYPLDRIGIDVMGPLNVTKDKNKYILVIGDYFTRWMEAYSLPSQHAEVVAEKLVHEFISRFGTPLEIHSDQGRNFESSLFKEVRNKEDQNYSIQANFEWFDRTF